MKPAFEFVDVDSGGGAAAVDGLSDVNFTAAGQKKKKKKPQI